jgi:hypothetical protein
MLSRYAMKPDSRLPNANFAVDGLTSIVSKDASRLESEHVHQEIVSGRSVLID